VLTSVRDLFDTLAFHVRGEWGPDLLVLKNYPGRPILVIPREARMAHIHLDIAATRSPCNNGDRIKNDSHQVKPRQATFWVLRRYSLARLRFKGNIAARK